MALGFSSSWTGGGGTPTLRGTTTDYSPLYGGKPTVPSPTATAGQAISGNIGNLASIYQLAGSVNQLNEDQLLANLAKNIPGYSGLTATSSRNIQSNLSGQLPSDVVNLIAQQAAERGVATGTMGSPNANAAMLRALGLTSLDLQHTGEQELTQAIQRTPQAPLLDVSRLLVTPEQEQAAQMAASLYASAPTPQGAYQASLGAAAAGLSAGQNAVPSGATIGRTYAGGLPGPGLDALGFANWDLPTPFTGTVSAGSTGTGYWSGGRYVEPGQVPSWEQYSGLGLPQQPSAETMNELFGDELISSGNQGFEASEY